MSNDEKTTAAPVEVQQQVNNKDVEEKELTKQTIEEVAKTDAPMDNGKTQQVEQPNDAAAAKEAEQAANDAAAAADTAAAKEPAAAPAPKAPKPTVHKADYEKDVVYLYQFSRTKNIPSPSPFCLKVETWLRMAGVKYENVDHRMKFRSSKGQLPFVELNGAEISDSAVIVKELGTHFGADLDASLTTEQRSTAHTTIAMLENHFHWIDVWWRTKNPDAMLQGYKIDLQHMVGSKLPVGLLKVFYRFSFRRRGLKKVRATGIGVHTPDEIVEMGKDDLKALESMLSDKAFFFGDEPTLLDAVVFSNVAQLAVVDKEVAHPLRDWLLENCSSLVQHFERMKQKYYPDWNEMCETLDMNTHLPKPVKEEKEPEKTEEKEEKKEEEKEKAEDEKEKEKETDEKKPSADAEEKPKETK